MNDKILDGEFLSAADEQAGHPDSVQLDSVQPDKEQPDSMQSEAAEHEAKEEHHRAKRETKYTDEERPEVEGILEIQEENNFGFLRFNNFLKSEK